MQTLKRAVCLLLAALLLALAAPPRTDAAGTVCFTAVNDTLLPLSDETMPFWSGGLLYVASMAFDGTDLGIYYSISRDRTTAVLYKQRSVMTFDIAAGTIETNNAQSYSGSVILRGDVAFLPLDVICRYFSLEYSYTRISYGYLVRVKSASVVLSDATFIDAASAPMAQRYARYERAQAEPEEPADAPAENAQTQTAAQRTVYFVIASGGAEKTTPLLARLAAGRVAYLFAPDALDGAGDLLRRLASGGGAIALRVDA
ncbi:MAG: hypothetical protein IJT71_00710, partial [Oscillospiraceae bacterium]|nr:hypothetical protein [Oscillospiraceae bacterium]